MAGVSVTATAQMKVHRRSVPLAGREYTVLSPRPSAGERYATNRYHQTWHVLSDAAGAHVLARYCWAMAFQRRAGTILVIDPPALVQNSDLGPFSRRAADSLRAALPFRRRRAGLLCCRPTGWTGGHGGTAISSAAG